MKEQANSRMVQSATIAARGAVPSPRLLKVAAAHPNVGPTGGV